MLKKSRRLLVSHGDFIWENRKCPNCESSKLVMDRVYPKPGFRVLEVPGRNGYLKARWERLFFIILPIFWHICSFSKVELWSYCKSLRKNLNFPKTWQKKLKKGLVDQIIRQITGNQNPILGTPSVTNINDSISALSYFCMVSRT